MQQIPAAFQDNTSEFKKICLASPLTGPRDVHAGEEHHGGSDTSQGSHDSLVVLIVSHGHDEGYWPLWEQLPDCLGQCCG